MWKTGENRSGNRTESGKQPVALGTCVPVINMEGTGMWKMRPPHPAAHGKSGKRGKENGKRRRKPRRGSRSGRAIAPAAWKRACQHAGGHFGRTLLTCVKKMSNPQVKQVGILSTCGPALSYGPSKGRKIRQRGFSTGLSTVRTCYAPVFSTLSTFFNDRLWTGADARGRPLRLKSGP